MWMEDGDTWPACQSAIGARFAQSLSCTFESTNLDRAKPRKPIESERDYEYFGDIPRLECTR